MVQRERAAQTRKRLEDERARAAEAQARQEQTRVVYTVASLVAQFSEQELPVHHKRPDWGAQLLGKHVAGRTGAMRLDAVDRAAIWRCLDPIRTARPQLARHVFGLARKLFAFAVSRGLMTHNPVAEIERQAVVPKPPSRTVTLTDEAIRFLWNDFAIDTP